MFKTEHSELSLDQHFEAFPLSQSWDNGTGRYSNNPVSSDGCSWRFRDNSVTGTNWYINSFGNATGSFAEDEIPGGGLWYYDYDANVGFEASASYSYNDELDLSLDVTSVIKKFYSGSQLSQTYPLGIDNNGFIIKRRDDQEFVTNNNGTLNYFSLDTHTIYPPTLDISWDDSDYDTSFATDDKIKKTGECYVTLRNNKSTYYKEEETTFRLNVRDLYPTRRFVTSSNYLDVNYFTSESFYSLIDYATEETVIPFGPTSKLSADAEGMYFKLYMNGLQEERYYKLLFKHHNDDGVTVYNEDYYFKINKS